MSNTGDEEPQPERLTADDVRGLRTETGRLATSIETLAARQNIADVKLEQKADRTQVEENRRLSKRANYNTLGFGLALLLAIGGFFYRVHQQDEQRKAGRESICNAFDSFTSALIGAAHADPAKAQPFLDDLNHRLAPLGCHITGG